MGKERKDPRNAVGSFRGHGLGSQTAWIQVCLSLLPLILGKQRSQEVSMSLLVKCCDSKSQGCGRVQQDPASDELSPALGKHSCPLPAPRFSTTSPSCPLSRGSETILSSSSLWFAVWREINQKDHKGRRGRVTGGLMGRAIITTQGPSISPFPGRGHRGPAGTRCHSQVCPYKAGAAPLT